MMTIKQIERQIKKFESEREAIYDYYINMTYDYTIPFNRDNVQKFIANNTNIMNQKVEAIDKIIYGLQDYQKYLGI